MANESHQQAAGAIRAFALGLPGAHEDFPWGERVVKVNNKIFVFLGLDDPQDSVLRFTVKLPQSSEAALTLPFTEPSGYNLGKHGWVVIRLPPDEEPPLDLFLEWVEESYRAVTPKKLVARLDELL